MRTQLAFALLACVPLAFTAMRLPSELRLVAALDRRDEACRVPDGRTDPWLLIGEEQAVLEQGGRALDLHCLGGRR